MIVLAGDVGGTNARLAFVELEGSRARMVQRETYPSRDYPGLAAIVRRFCAGAGSLPERACFGIACAVVGDDCSTPNLPWTVNARDLAADIGIPRTTIINDFVAIGYGIEFLVPTDLATLQAGNPTAHGPIALIGAGTGLGQGFLVWNDDHYRVLPSEGGHARLRAERQAADRVCSSSSVRNSVECPGSDCSRDAGSATRTGIFVAPG